MLKQKRPSNTDLRSSSLFLSGIAHPSPCVFCAGAIAAVLVGAATLGSSLRAGATLLAFYASSSKLTNLKEELKEVDEDFKKGGQRNWVQVRASLEDVQLAASFQ